MPAARGRRKCLHSLYSLTQYSLTLSSGRNPNTRHPHFSYTYQHCAVSDTLLDILVCQGLWRMAAREVGVCVCVCVCISLVILYYACFNFMCLVMCVYLHFLCSVYILCLLFCSFLFFVILMFCSCFFVIVILLFCVFFIFVFTSVGLLPPGEA
jgi:hypothetical protein